MLLTIHNLPINTQYAQVKELIINKCGLKEAILDNLENEGNGMRVTVGVIEEEDAALLVRKINGLYYKGQQLYVKNKKQTKESDQPYRISGSQLPMYPAVNVAASMQQQQYQGHEYASLQQASMQYAMQNNYTMYQPQANLQSVQNSFMAYGGNQPQMLPPQYNEYAQQSYGPLDQRGKAVVQLGHRSPSPMNQRQWPEKDMERGDHGRGRDRSRSRDNPSNYHYEFNRDSTQSQDRFETRGPRQNDNSRGGHAPFDRDQDSGHAPFDRDQGSNYGPTDRNTRGGHSSFNRQSRGGHSSDFNSRGSQSSFDRNSRDGQVPVVRDARVGHSSFDHNSRGDHSSFDRNSRGSHSSFDRNLRGGHSSFDRNSRGGHSSLDHNSRGGHSSFDRNSRGGHSSFDHNSRGGHSSVDRNSRGGHSSFNHNSRGGHSSFDHNSRGGHSSFDRNSRGGHSSFDNNSRGGHSSFDHNSRGGQSSFDRKSRGGYAPVITDSRGGHTPFNRDSRDINHTSNDRRESNSQYIRDSRCDQGPNSPKNSRKRRWDKIPDLYEPKQDPEDEPLGIPHQSPEQFGAPMDFSYAKQMRFSKLKGAGKIMYEIARNLKILEMFAAPNPIKKALRKVVHHRVAEVVNRDILSQEEIFSRYRVKYPAGDDIELYNYIKGRVESGTKIPNSKLEFVPNKTGLTTKERKEVKKMAIVPRKHLRLPSHHPVNPEKIPNYPQGDKKLFTKLKQQNKEDMTTLAPYEVSEIYQKVMDEEASVISKLIENVFNNPKDQKEKTVYESVNKQSCIEECKKLIIHHLSRRLTNNGVKLVRVMFRPKPPRRQALEQLMAKHGCLSLKKSVRSPFYTACFDSYETIDKLCAMDPVHVGENIYVYFKHMHVAPKGSKKNSVQKHGEIESLRKKYVNSLKEKTKVNLLDKDWQTQEEQEKKLEKTGDVVDTDDVILVSDYTENTIDITQEDDVNAADAKQSDNQGFLHADFQVIDEVKGSDNDETANKDGGNDTQISMDWDETGDDWGDQTGGDGDKNDNSGEGKKTASDDGVENDAVADDVKDDNDDVDFDTEGISADIDAADVDWDDINEDDLEDY